MSNTVYAGGMGLFHKNSGGHGEAFPDTCLSPPPPPGGPAPLPYPNSLKASDLSDGSKTVKVQGAETALEDASNVSTSSGDEGGTQGGNVVTHKTKGKGYFMMWSLDVFVEGKGVARHGDPMGQNCASSPPGAADIMAMVNQSVIEALNPFRPCTVAYDSEIHRTDMSSVQYNRVNRTVNGKPPQCWQCASTSPLGNDASGNPIPHGPNDQFTPDHQPPVMVRWYAGGCHMTPAQWRHDFRRADKVFPHCRNCSNGQGGMSAESEALFNRHQELLGSPAARGWAGIR
jgi:hypothetical protein